ncbi:CYTH and CHAD domain-containing protein [Planosporangium flavigriseum]|uniref:CHAD domain-containing protein n=1 Tax=Planosporangium flavigriseum TaxID=373681 RepID=A0A8J3PNN6_9ACTN|nr:CYTH and CHAD domain-containing protein [Planosporangium flavigriseum]NJC67125.1 CYTH and CHAD domain-containing protein [Planosporangium flavigriseum]GIG75529.1 CHAD domain-containing protein [Planosporangium flavigriseum]
MPTKTEVERKYEVPVDFAVPDLTGLRGVTVVDEPVEHRLDAIYYDTPGLRLAAHGVTLRRRSGGHDAGWHLKRPVRNGDRTETQVPLDGHAGEIPPAVLDEVRALSRGEPLAPVARVRTRRLERPLRAADGTVFALLADDVVSSETMGEQALVQQWRELEVELVDGPRRVLDAVDEVLRAAGARPARVASKLARALADRYPDGRRRSGNDQVLNAYLGKQRDAIVSNDPGVRRGDPDAVHAMRVATRRLRGTLRTFRPLLDADRAEPLREELKWLGQVLGEVRDGDVMAVRLDRAVRAEPVELVVGPVVAHIHGRLASRTAEARVRLIEALDSPRYAALLNALDDVVAAEPRVPATGKRLRRFARKALRRADERLDRAVGGGRNDAAGDGRNDAHLHDARKAYKRARYAAEAIAPLAGKPARRLTKRLTALQDVLGAHQDTITTGELLREYGMRAHLDGANAFTYGLLHARQHDADLRRLERLCEVRRRAGEPKVRRWLKA